MGKPILTSFYLILPCTLPGVEPGTFGLPLDRPTVSATEDSYETLLREPITSYANSETARSYWLRDGGLEHVQVFLSIQPRCAPVSSQRTENVLVLQSRTLTIPSRRLMGLRGD